MRSLTLILTLSGGLVPFAFAQDPFLSFEQTAGSEFGFSVAAAGDVNRDGYPDFVVGEPEGAGRVVLYSGVTKTPLWVFRGNQAGDRLGYTVAGIGDANGDGFDDIAACALEASDPGPNAGQVYVVDGLTGEVEWTVKGDAANWYWGQHIDGAGDINGDGFDDVIVSSEVADPNGPFSGVMRIYSGRDGSVLRELIGPNLFFGLGSSVAGVGDVNADGFDDYIVGADSDDTVGDGRGSAIVYSGHDGSVLFRFDGENDFDFFGKDVDGGYDHNGDGIPDFVVGATNTDYSGSFAGSVYVYSGADGSELWRIDGPYAYNYFGSEVVAAGDLNADGIDDVLVGDPRGGFDGVVTADGVGYCTAFSGADGTQLWRIEGSMEGDRLGQSVASLGDLNADGAEEIIIGAPAYLSAADQGYVRVYNCTPRGVLFLGLVSPQSGQYMRAFIILAQPRTVISTYVGSGLGSSAVPGVGRLDIRQPMLIDTGATNGAGNKWVGFYVPPQWAGRRITMQSIDEYGTKSLPLTRVIL